MWAIQHWQNSFITRGASWSGHKRFQLAKEILLHFLFIDHVIQAP